MMYSSKKENFFICHKLAGYKHSMERGLAFRHWDWRSRSEDFQLSSISRGSNRWNEGSKDHHNFFNTMGELNERYSRANHDDFLPTHLDLGHLDEKLQLFK